MSNESPAVVSFSTSNPKNATYDPKIIIVLFCAGLITDFLVNGVFKIVWVIVYGAVYLGITATIYNYLVSGRWRLNARLGAASFLFGALLCHLFFAAKTETRLYQMNLISRVPLILASTDFSDQLYVSSENLDKQLLQTKLHEKVPVGIEVVKTYGCLESFNVSLIAGINVKLDPTASWVWRKTVPTETSNPIFLATQLKPKDKLDAAAGIEAENGRRPWCQIHWF